MGLLDIKLLAGVDPTGVSDSSVAIQSALNLGMPLLFSAGKYLLNTTLTLPSCTYIEGTLKTSLVGNISGTNVANAIFYAGTATSDIGGLMADAVQGSKTVLCSATVASGSWVHVYGQGSFATCRTPYKVMSSSVSSSVYTLTLDRAVQILYTSGSKVAQVTGLKNNIRIEGNGMVLTGSSFRMVELAGTIDCVVKGLRITPSASADICCSYDVGGLNNVFEDIVVDASLSGNGTGIALESQEGGKVINCIAHHCSYNGFTSYTPVFCEHVGCEAYLNGHIGMDYTADGHTHGAIGSKIIGGNFCNNGQYGIDVAQGSKVFINDVVVNDNGTYGCLIESTCVATHIGTIEASRNTDSGIVLLSQTLLDGVSTYNNTNYGMLVEADAEIQGWYGSNPGGAGGLYLAGGGGFNVTLNGVRVDTLYGSTIRIDAGATLRMSNGRITPGATAGVLNAGNLYATQVSVDGTGAGTGVSNSGTVQMDKSCDLSGCATPFTGSGTFTMPCRESYMSKNAGNANYTYTWDEAMNGTVVDVSSLTANRDRVLPNVSGRVYRVKNATSGSFNLVFKVSGSTGVSVALGHDVIVCNGVDYERWTGLI